MSSERLEEMLQKQVSNGSNCENILSQIINYLAPNYGKQISGKVQPQMKHPTASNKQN